MRHVANPDPEKVVLAAFKALATFITDGQKQMLDVADLSALQTQIESFVATRDPKLPIPADIKFGFANIMGKDNQTCKAADASGLNWMKLEKGAPGFVGGLEGYVASRRAQLFPAHRGGGMNELQQKAILTDFKERALAAGTTIALQLMWAEPKYGVVRTKILENAKAVKGKPGAVDENLRYLEALRDLKVAQSLSDESVSRSNLIEHFISENLNFRVGEHDESPTKANVSNPGRFTEAMGYLDDLTRPGHNGVSALQFLKHHKIENGLLPTEFFYAPVDRLVNASSNETPNTYETDTSLETLNRALSKGTPPIDLTDFLTRQDTFFKKNLGAGITPAEKDEIIHLHQRALTSGESQPDAIKALGDKLNITLSKARDELTLATQTKISKLQNLFIDQHLGENSRLANAITPRLRAEIFELQQSVSGGLQHEARRIKALGEKIASIPNDLMPKAAASPEYAEHVRSALNQAIGMWLEFTEMEVGKEFAINSLKPPNAKNDNGSLLTF